MHVCAHVSMRQRDVYAKMLLKTLIVPNSFFSDILALRMNKHAAGVTYKLYLRCVLWVSEDNLCVYVGMYVDGSL